MTSRESPGIEACSEPMWRALEACCKLLSSITDRQDSNLRPPGRHSRRSNRLNYGITLCIAALHYTATTCPSECEGRSDKLSSFIPSVRKVRYWSSNGCVATPYEGEASRLTGHTQAHVIVAATLCFHFAPYALVRRSDMCGIPTCLELES